MNPAGRPDLSRYDNSWYRPGPAWKRLAWYLVNAVFFLNPLNPSSGLKAWWLRVFGARVGRGVVIKPGVNVKYPWFLTIGDHVWIGENVWIDNLADVSLGAHVCLSQGALLLTGNHDFKAPAFDLRVRPIVLEDGVWIGARAVVCPGVHAQSHAVLTVGSVATQNLDAYGIYQGNPAARVKQRVIATTNHRAGQAYE